MKKLNQLTKKDKIDLLEAIKAGQINPNEINEDTLFCTGDVFWDNYILIDEMECGEPMKKLVYIGEGIVNWDMFLKNIEETSKEMEKRYKNET